MLSLLIFLSFKKQVLNCLTRFRFRPFSLILFFCLFNSPAFGDQCYLLNGKEYRDCAFEVNKRQRCMGLLREAECKKCENENCISDLLEAEDKNSDTNGVANTSATSQRANECANPKTRSHCEQCNNTDYDSCISKLGHGTPQIDNTNVSNTDSNHATASTAFCAKKCEGYITTTTKGCPEVIDNTSCAKNCSDIAGTGYGNYKERDAQAITNTIDGKRPACVRKAKNEYVKSFKTQCKNQITGVETAKGRKISCGGEGEDSCDTYCETKAKNTYGTSVTEDEILLALSVIGHDHRGYDLSDNKVISYRSLTKKPKDVAVEQVEIKFTPDIISAELEDDDSNNLSWASCEVGSCGNAEFELTEALDDALETCHELETEALECCHNPEECVGGNLAKALDSINKGYLAVSSTRSRKAMCKAVENVYGLFAGMQGAMATQCTKKSNKCIDECETHLLTVATKMEKACGANFSPNRKPTYSKSTYTCSEEFFKKYITPYYEGTNNKQRLLTEVPKDCKTTGNNANSRIEDMSSNAIASIVASREECKRDPSTSRLVTDPEDPPPPPTVEIPPPPEEETGDGSGGKETDYAVGDDTSPDPTPGIPDDDDPLEEEPGLVPETPKGGGPGGLISGQGGGGLGGLGGMGGGGPRGGNRRGPGGEKKKESLLLGLLGSKFKGYLSGSPDNNEGGGKGVGKAKSKKASKLAELDLNKILPKSRIFQKVGKYGAPHENIFEKVSTRIEYMCRTKRLDCSR